MALASSYWLSLLLLCYITTLDQTRLCQIRQMRILWKYVNFVCLNSVLSDSTLTNKLCITILQLTFFFGQTIEQSTQTLFYGGGRFKHETIGLLVTGWMENWYDLGHVMYDKDTLYNFAHLLPKHNMYNIHIQIIMKSQLEKGGPMSSINFSIDS